MTTTHRDHPTLGAALLALALLGACADQGPGISLADDTPDAGCTRPKEPSTYEISFVLDVSGSMAPFLTDLKNELVSFADALPEFDSEGRRVRVDYYLVGFVNDTKLYGDGRMTSILALQAAFDQAIREGLTNYNLTVNSFNAEPEENLLDGVNTALDLGQGAEARMMILATDAPFVEAPTVLSENLAVKASYGEVRDRLAQASVRVHAFTERDLDGLTRGFGRQLSLTSLPGSSVHNLQNLRGETQAIRDTLADIAAKSACN